MKHDDAYGAHKTCSVTQIYQIRGRNKMKTLEGRMGKAYHCKKESNELTTTLVGEVLLSR